MKTLKMPASRMIRHVFACQYGVKFQLKKYIGKTYKELGQFEVKGGINFSREDEAELDEDDIPYVNYGMHLLIKHYFDQYSVDEFDIEDHEVQQHSTNRKGRAPTAKVQNVGTLA